jgi:hypothetical protein
LGWSYNRLHAGNKGKLNIFYEKKCNRLHFFKLIATLVVRFGKLLTVITKEITIDLMLPKQIPATFSEQPMSSKDRLGGVLPSFWPFLSSLFIIGAGQTENVPKVQLVLYKDKPIVNQNLQI